MAGNPVTYEYRFERVMINRGGVKGSLGTEYHALANQPGAQGWKLAHVHSPVFSDIGAYWVELIFEKVKN